MKGQFKSRKSWREKLEKPQQPRLVKVPSKMSRFGKGTMLIPTAKLVDDLIRRIPKGRLVTVGEIRRKLAKDFAADVTCPLTTGIFVRIAAEAAAEDRANGHRRITPYWRVVKDDGSFNPKFPGGEKLQTQYLRDEGLSIVRKGNHAAVRDFEQFVASLQ